MSKKHKKRNSAKEHKAEVSVSKTESKKDSKILGFELNTILLIAALVIATAIVSTWAGFGIAQNNFAQQNENLNLGSNLDLVDSSALKIKVEKYVNDYLLGVEGVSLKITNAVEVSTGFFEMPFEIYEDGAVVSMGSVYANKDKVFLVQAAFDLDKPLELPSVESEPTVSTKELTEEEKAEVLAFSDCLAEKGVVVYGANWCGYTNNLVDNLGGFELVSPFYVECTVEDELCNEKEIRGYPTVTLNGEVINPERTFAGFASVTGCTPPSFSQGVEAQAYTGGC
ncbi:MAG: hypothetical protein ACOX1V_04545 [Candidatus Iainarchaeum sp.]|jgi:hypothetical protein